MILGLELRINYKLNRMVYLELSRTDVGIYYEQCDLEALEIKLNLTLAYFTYLQLSVRYETGKEPS